MLYIKDPICSFDSRKDAAVKDPMLLENRKDVTVRAVDDTQNKRVWLDRNGTREKAVEIGNLKRGVCLCKYVID